MDPASLAILAAAGISSAGALYANSRNASLSREQLNYQRLVNDINWQIAAQNNATQIEMANSAHQREVADLKAAGLNPILSAGGHGAATPSLTTANGHVTSVGSPYDNPAEGAASSARSLARYFGDLYNEQLATAKADTRLAESNAKIANHNVERASVDALENTMRYQALEDLGFIGYYDPKTHERRLAVDLNSDYYKQYKDGMLEDAKMAARQGIYKNWQMGLETLNGAGSLYRGLRGNNRNINYYNW